MNCMQQHELLHLNPACFCRSALCTIKSCAEHKHWTATPIWTHDRMRWSACRHSQRLPQSGFQHGFPGVSLCLVQCKAAHSPCTPLLPICNMPAHSILCSEYLVVHVCRSLVLTALLGLQQFTMICSALEMAQQKALLQPTLAWSVQLPATPTVLCKSQHSHSS